MFYLFSSLLCLLFIFLSFSLFFFWLCLVYPLSLSFLSEFFLSLFSVFSFFSHSSLRHGSETNVGGAVNPDLHKLKNSKEKTTTTHLIITYAYSFKNNKISTTTHTHTHTTYFFVCVCRRPPRWGRQVKKKKEFFTIASSHEIYFPTRTNLFFFCWHKSFFIF